MGAFIYGIWNYAQLVLLTLATAYVASGIVIRIGGIVRRRLQIRRHRRPPEHQGWLTHRPLPWSAAIAARPRNPRHRGHHRQPDLDLRLIAAEEEEAGTLTALGDEPAVVSELDAESLRDARAVLLAASPESSRKALELLGDPPDAAIIDLTYAAEDAPRRGCALRWSNPCRMEDPAERRST